ncbi:hypothetical protein BBJ28_00023176 [Nothophytophthora sp. Chile5]|nr:hypothetical protein BBJ28_00023176 [Nothophytophthora sp. Chile5]
MTLSMSAAKHKQQLDDEKTKTANDVETDCTDGVPESEDVPSELTTHGRGVNKVILKKVEEENATFLREHRQHERSDALYMPGGESQPPLRQDATTSVAEEEQQVAAIMATLSSSVDVPDSVGERLAAPEPRMGLAEEMVDSPALTGSVSPADPCSLRQVRVIGRPDATGPTITSTARAEGSLGLTAWASQAFVDEFRADNCSAVTEMGLEWPTLLRFIKSCNKCAHVAGDGEVCQYTLKKNLRRDSNTGTRVTAQLCELPLAEGVYICAGFIPQRVSHCFALNVTQLGRFATDEDFRVMPLLEYVHPWLAGLQFVRWMVVRK